MDAVLIPAIVIGLVAVYPGWLMLQKAYFIAKWRIASIVMCLLLAAALAVGFFYLTFWVSQGKQLNNSMDTFVDLILYAAFPLGLIALLAYVMEHVHESPKRAVLSGAACFAIAALPILYYCYAPQMHEKFEITTKQENSTKQIVDE